MSWIKVIQENEAVGEVKEWFEKLMTPQGFVDNILKIHSLNIPSLSAHLGIYRTLMFGRSQLSRIQREMIAVIVSSSNQCHY